MSALLALGLPTSAAAVLAFALTPLVARLAVLVGAIDMPGARKLHTHPIPRLGGLAVIMSIVGVWVMRDVLTPAGWSLPGPLLAGLTLGLIPIMVVSLVDDLRGVGPAVKCLAHFAGAVIAVAYGVSLEAEVRLFGGIIALDAWAIPISILWIVGVTNAFNLIDGLDGLSAGLALISATSMAAVFGLVGQPVMAGATLVLAGALAGFLPYNLYPARLFLGDTGATAVGFTLAIFALEGGSTLSTGFAVLVPVFILGLPIADTLVTMGRRLVNRMEAQGQGVFVGDRNHIHHRLLSLGIGHREAVLILYGAGVILAGAALVSMFLSARDAALFVLALLLAGLIGVQRLGYDEFAFIRKGTVLRLYEAPVVSRSMFAVFVDVAMAAFSAYVAVGLKFDTWHPNETHGMVVPLASMLAPLTVAVFWRAGIYRGSWRLAGIDDVLLACKGAVSVAFLGLGLQLVVPAASYPASLFLIYGFVSTVLFVASRASYVVLLSLTERASVRGVPVLIYGASAGGVTVVRELRRNSTTGLAPIGFIDDNPAKSGKVVAGLPVLGALSELREIARRENAEALLVTTQKANSDNVDCVLKASKEAGVGVFRMRTTVEQVGEIGRNMGLSEAFAKSTGKAGSLAVTSLPEGRRRRDLVSVRQQPADQLDFASKKSLQASPSGPMCPDCLSGEIHRSHARGHVERLRRLLTKRRLHRCYECGWRGWFEVVEGRHEVLPAGTSSIKPPDFGAIDVVIKTGIRRSPRQSLTQLGHS